MEKAGWAARMNLVPVLERAVFDRLAQSRSLARRHGSGSRPTLLSATAEPITLKNDWVIMMVSLRFSYQDFVALCRRNCSELASKKPCGSSKIKGMLSHPEILKTELPA